MHPPLATEAPAPRSPVGLDIGGANIKLSDGRTFSHHEPFALWQQPAELTPTLTRLLGNAPPHDLVAITMTGELTDCFANKKEGVEFIIDSTCAATAVAVQVYMVDGLFAEPENAKKDFELAAASNWHALTNCVANAIADAGDGILIDIGSTTTDLIPFRDGNVMAAGTNDFGRLINGELVYTGAIRSSLAGIVAEVVHRNIKCPTMNELFATTLDTNIILQHIPPGTQCHYAADGQGTSVEACVRRMARLIGKDDLTFDLSDAREIALQVFDRQVSGIADAAHQVISNHRLKEFNLIASGQGEFVASAVHQRLSESISGIRLIRLSHRLDSQISTCATAWSIAGLARDTFCTTKTIAGNRGG